MRMSFPETFYAVDVAFAVFVVLFGATGLLLGFAGELARLLVISTLAAVVVFFYPQLSGLAMQQWPSLPANAVHVVVGLVLLSASFLLYLLLRQVLKMMVEKKIGAVFDHILGGLTGLLLGTLGGLLLLTSMTLRPPESRTYVVISERSVIGAWVCENLAPRLVPRLRALPVFEGPQEEVPEE